MSRILWMAGRIAELADDTARTVTTYDDAGTVTSTRPYTAEENAAADAAAVDAAVALVQKQADTVRTDDRTAAQNLLDRITDDIGPTPTATDIWPTVQTWRTLAAVKRADLATATALAQVIVWMVPAILRIAKASRKALRLALDDTTSDTTD